MARIIPYKIEEDKKELKQVKWLRNW